MTNIGTHLRLRTDLRLATDWRAGKRLARRRAYAACIDALRNPAQQALVERLRATVLAERAQSQEACGSDVWDLARRRLVEHIRDDDPRRFLRWPEVRATMFVAKSGYSSAELGALMCHHAWSRRWRAALAEDPCGCPTPSRLAPDMSDNLIHHVYHALTIEEHLGDIQDFAQIVEFGGGYGSFPRIVRRLGVAAHYHLHDLPEFTALQRYYLASVALHRGEPAIGRNVTWGSAIDELPARKAPRLFLAFWSLSEMPLSERAPWRDVITESDGVVIAFQAKFEDADNMLWFDMLQNQREFTWSCWEISHLRGNFYLVGRRRRARAGV
jgi:hypothetical protein